VAGALIDAGADIEAPDGSIGTPLGNACWHVARLLGARGARVDKLLYAAALGMTTRLEELLAERPAVEPGELSQAFWHACAGGQRRAAEYLLICGADSEVGPRLCEGDPFGCRPWPRHSSGDPDQLASRPRCPFLGTTGMTSRTSCDGRPILRR
jgi:hypothetical protein